MTGNPTFCPDQSSPDGFSYLVDVDIEVRLLDTYPAIANRIVSIYRDACERTPCIVQTKFGSLRISAFCAYLDSKREFRDKDRNQMLLDIFSQKGLSRLSARDAILEGSVLNPPIIPKSALQDIHRLISEVGKEKQYECSRRETEKSGLQSIH